MHTIREKRMISLREKYKKLNLNGTWIGFIQMEENEGDFCTPVGADIIGWTGVDGIHFCLVEGQGDTVFCVNPSAYVGEYVHAVSNSFEDFLRLLITVGSTDVIDQGAFLNEEDFLFYKRENPLAKEQKEIMDCIAQNLNLTPLDDPLKYLKDVHQNNDCSLLEYEDDLYKVRRPKMILPEWKVTLDAEYFSMVTDEEAGHEVRVMQEFVWEESKWIVLSYYQFDEGIVIDLAKQVNEQELNTFREKWIDGSEDWSDMPEEMMEQMMSENPTNESFVPSLLINGYGMEWSGSCCVGFTPTIEEDEANSVEAESIMEHYQLSKENSWQHFRICFRVGDDMISMNHLDENMTCQKDFSMKLTLSQERKPVSGPHFHNLKQGELRKFVHPFTGDMHVLNVLDVKQERLTEEIYSDEQYLYPRCMTVITYAITPQIERGTYQLRDCSKSEQRIRREEVIESDLFLPTMTSSEQVIIGGSDGLTSIFIAAKSSQSGVTSASSSLTFEPKEEIEWRLTFYKKMREDIIITI